MADSFTNAGLYVAAFFATSISLCALPAYFILQGFLASILKKIRTRNFKQHRFTGKIYAVAASCLASASGMVPTFCGRFSGAAVTGLHINKLRNTRVTFGNEMCTMANNFCSTKVWYNF